jgi:hypothetical protein
MSGGKRKLLLVSIITLSFAQAVIGQPAVYLTNIGPNLRVPFLDTYGCLLGDTWKADLVAGPDASQLSPWGAPTSFISTNGCGTGFFNGGNVTVQTVPPFGTLSARIRVWTGADTFDAAMAGDKPSAQTPVVSINVTGNGPYYLTGLQAPGAGPIATWLEGTRVDGLESDEIPKHHLASSHFIPCLQLA